MVGNSPSRSARLAALEFLKSLVIVALETMSQWAVTLDSDWLEFHGAGQASAPFRENLQALTYLVS